MTIPLQRLIVAPALLLAALLAAGCSNVVPSTGPHPATIPSQIKLYSEPPNSDYELLGQITLPITPDMKWDSQGDSNRGYEMLIAKAALMGANGILFKIDQSQFDYLVNVGYNGSFHNVPMRKEPRTAVAEAIFVHQ